MQTSICEVCLNSEILCSFCQEKLNKGQITAFEVEASRFLFDLSKNINSLRDIRIVKIIDCGIMLIVTDRGSAAKLVGKNGAIVKKIAKRFRKSIRILEEATDFREFIEGLTSPVSINGINTLYKDDREIYKIRIPSLKKNHLLISPENFSRLLSDFYKINAELVFE